MSDLKSATKVGDDVPSQCGACKELTAHTVLSMGDTRPLRVRCKVCDRDHNYRPPPKARANRPVKKNPDVVRWEEVSTRWDAAKAKTYALDGAFNQGDLVDHARFGLGKVQSVTGAGRMRVLFQTGVKLMVCGPG